MADWSLPVLTTDYVDVLTGLLARDVDALTLCYSTPTNIPTGAVRFDRNLYKFQEFNGVSWGTLYITIEGGGTGSVTAAGARTNLGLGTLAVQNSNAVTITGGAISGVALSAADVSSGTLACARGGTGISSYTAGDLIYASAATTFSKLALGDADYILAVNPAGTGLAYTNEIAIAYGYFSDSIEIEGVANLLTVAYEIATRVTGLKVNADIDGNVLFTATRISGGPLQYAAFTFMGSELDIQCGDVTITGTLLITSTVQFSGYGAGVATFDANGIISSSTNLAGTKVYYLSDTEGGYGDRKLTFTNGLLTSET
jgi:hypothetical protein